MLIRREAPRGGADLEVRVDDPDATVADLSVALDPDRPAGPLVIDGRPVAPATPLDRAGLADGALVRRADEPSPAHLGTAPAPAADVVVIGGLDAGRRVPLPPGSHVIGRAGAPVQIVDPTVSRRHAHLRLDPAGRGEVEDLDSTNGTRVDGRVGTGRVAVEHGSILELGGARLRLDAHLIPPPLPAPPPGARTRPFHRPHRADPPTHDPTAIEPPPVPPPPGRAATAGAVAVLGSLAMAGAMVAVLGSWRYAVFAVLGPLLLIANAVDGRVRHGRQRRRGRRRRAAELARFAERLAARRSADLAADEAAFAGPAVAADRARAADPRCWERRPGDPDAFAVRVGRGARPWVPPLPAPRRDDPADVHDAVEPLRVVDDGPIGLVLVPGALVAIRGSREIVRSTARSLVVQAVVAHGPADLELAVLTDAAGRPAWDWCAWLPHTRDPDGLVLLAADEPAADEVARSRTAEPPVRDAGGVDPQPTRRVVVIDDPAAFATSRSPARSVLRAAAEPSAQLTVVLLLDADVDPPAGTTVLLQVADDATLLAPADLAVGPARADGTALDVAAEVARSLARFDDPDRVDATRQLPTSIALTSLAPPSATTARGLAAAWRAAGSDPPPRAVIGVGPDGPVAVDLAADGPHALVAGTTGSGKSELLRTLVASLAAASSPDLLTFVLVDFKGGSAFDACARLPHTTGVVTDLDDALAARALRCLEAELRHREERLRDAGADDLAALRRTGPAEPLPRLVVVVDEFATLAAELPDFVSALVGIAQRGRSLGVHLVLATQRPSGCVSENIRANTAIRIALRVQSGTDSSDVIDVPAAAGLPRHVPGRALVRLGPGELLPVQTALATARPGAGRGPIEAVPLGIATTGDGGGGTRVGPADPEPGGPSDLDRLVDAAREAWADLGGRAPRRPWPDPLPEELAWPLPSTGSADQPEAEAEGIGLVLGLADDPDRQRQVPFRWHLDHGPLLLVGLPGSGTTTALGTLALVAAQRWSADECHIHVVDLGGGLVPLAGLPHVGAVVEADHVERQRRLFAELAEDLAERRRGRRDRAECHPRRLVLVDGVGALRSMWPDLEPTGTWEHVVEVATRGAGVGIHVALVGEGPSAVPHRLVAACRQRLVFRLGERSDHSAFGIPASAVPALGPGRAIAAEDAALVQVARPPEGLAAGVARSASVADRAPDRPDPAGDEGEVDGRRPAWVATLGTHVDDAMVDAAPLPATPRRDGAALLLPVGIADVGLTAAHLVLEPGSHALVAGPPRSGKTTALATLARRAASLGCAVVELRSRASTTDREATWPVVGLDDPDLDERIEGPGPLVVIVDDADRVADDQPVLRRLATERRPGRHLIVAGRSDRLRAAYGHWSREVRADRTGLLLVPDPDLDGELLGTRLPRHPPVALRPGLAWACGATPEGFVQVSAGPAASRNPTVDGR